MSISDVETPHVESPCGGYCCERFHFRTNDTPEQLKEWVSGPGALEANKQVVEMVVYLGESTLDADGEEGPSRHWYTCKHFNRETRLCTIYETRPAMCRNYNTKPWNSCGLKKCKALRPEHEPKSYPKLELREASYGLPNDDRSSQ